MFGGDMLNMYNQVVDDLKKAYKEIDDLKQELQRKDNIIDELEEKIIDVCETCYEDKETARMKKWIDKIKKIEGQDE